MIPDTDMIDDNSIIEPDDQFGPPGEAYREIIQEQKNEIKRLKQSRDILSDLLYKMEAKANNHEKLITELCDALERIPIGLTPPDRELVQRAREATR